MKYRDWSVLPANSQSRQMLMENGYSPLLASVLAARGFDTLEKATELICPKEEILPAPFLMRDMDKAVQRIQSALRDGEKMAVYGDYDVDGITSASLMTDFLQRRGGDVSFYIPDRIAEGYGLNTEAVRELAMRGVKLIITVDCGVTAVPEVALATTLGVDVVVTDHHSCRDELPRACAVVNPQRPDCDYPFKGLAGVGVALKVVMGIAGEAEYDTVFSEYCDLAAIGTIADVMPMTGENRVIVRRGLKALNSRPRLGLSLLMQEAGLEGKPVSTTMIGYTLAPRINASGRMGKAELAAELMLTQDEQRGNELAQALCVLNRDRQEIEGEIFQQCVDKLEQRPQEDVILMAGEQWHQGVIGIVASRLSERYGCPSFMVCLNGGMGKGSCRSWGGVDLFSLLGRCQDLLEEFGGHKLAAGFTVREEQIERFANRLREELPNTVDGAEEACLLLDCVVGGEDLTQSAIDELDRLEPCGVENPRPAFLMQGAQVLSLNQVGRGRHLKLRLSNRGCALDAIWFSAGAEMANLSVGQRVDVAFYPQVNEFRGQRTPQMQIIALRDASMRTRMERGLIEKYSQGEPLSDDEARSLLPEREEFVRLWRYLKGRSATAAVIQDTFGHIAHSTAGNGIRAAVPHTVVCLDVMEERGLIRMARHTDRVSITINAVEKKVDLEQSHILRRLRQFAGC